MNDFCRVITNTGKEVLIREDSTNLDQFEAKKNDILLLINKHNKILLIARSSNNLSLKQKYADARNNAKDIVKIAKSRQIASLADRMSNMNKTLRDTWKAIRILKKSFLEYHNDYILMKLKREDSSLTITDRENIIFLPRYFCRV